MPRFYIRKTSRASYTSDDLKRAIADVKVGLLYCQQQKNMA